PAGRGHRPRRAYGAARGARRLVLGFAPGLTVSPAVRAFAQAHPGVEVELLHLNWFEQAEAMRDGRADVGYLRQPFDRAGLKTLRVGSEPKVVCLPAAHPLAARRRVRHADLDGEHVIDAQTRRISTIEEKLELVAAGLGITMIPRSVARYYSRPDVVHRTISDAEEFEICLAVADGHRRPHLEDFVAIAARALSG
ncbi:LysR family substrate-binding domain-containing protein, partial [Amycolatopsis sp. NPDC006125]|uniref:LysR family substrate-binding domain-containing protein n=1 Tax=Amycolatopsis sp. NPDC006125 TaxID=3156730 RepID=UPI0033B7FB86